MNARTLLRESFARLVLWSGVVAAVRKFLWRDRVAILLYHNPSPSTLDAHLSYLARICDIVPLDALSQPGRGRPRAVITLDDGHAGNAALLPVFDKHRVRPTIFLCSGVIEHRAAHWWMHPAAAGTDIERLKRLPNRERLAQLHERGYQGAELQQVLPMLLGGGQLREPTIADEGRDHTASTGLSVRQVKQMRARVDFQSHTRFHPILTRCDDAECEQEITGSRRDIERLTGRPCVHFAYPNGNYGEREIRLLRAAGYRTARTCDVGWNDDATDPFRLRAIDIHDDSSLAWFIAQLTGIPLFLRYARHGGGWRGRKPQF